VTAAHAEREPTVGDEVDRGRLLGEVQRVLVAHVDDARAHLDALRLRGDRGEQRHGEACWRAKWCTRK
jgi:hypothetical protein